MKELSIEEKAKAYDEALEKARQLCSYPTTKPFISDLQDLFPELKESEDEKIRKEIIGHFRNTRCVTEEGAERIAKWLSWLEKQGNINPTEDELEALRIAAYEPTKNWSEKLQSLYEKLTHCEQKLAFEMKSPEESLGISSETYNKIVDECIYGEQKPAWSEEDNNCLSTIIAEFSKSAGKSVSKDEWMRCNDWLNSLRNRVQPQPKQEWSEKDKALLDGAKWQEEKDNEEKVLTYKHGFEDCKEQMIKYAVDACVTDIRTYKKENEVDFTVMYEKGIIPYEIEQEVKLIIIKED